MEPVILRKKILQERDSLSVVEQYNRSCLITDRIKNMPQYQSSSVVCLYADFRSEVVTRPLIDHIISSDKRAVLPVTLVKKRELLVVSISDPDNELAPGYCSIPEPVPDICNRQKVSPDLIDIIFLPGSVFDERGGRMGYGGGYYDRFVSAKAPQAIRVGLAFELQIVKRAPLQDHDELLDYIVTEKRIIKGTR